ncbi:hypothetical protein FIBSPDRAFT_933917 [Athelia psychrophila]|uniref:Uncharacterized protein n=1 Tax=Athelia psychrophila TaxID=1759441 RepID=A0A166G7F1_9AGAM|nr:hypothetical protein FIBSPDRAFT_933917 [Fibularhizoctonia sp. CBS 109695]
MPFVASSQVADGPFCKDKATRNWARYSISWRTMLFRCQWGYAGLPTANVDGPSGWVDRQVQGLFLIVLGLYAAIWLMTDWRKMPTGVEEWGLVKIKAQLPTAETQGDEQAQDNSTICHLSLTLEIPRPIEITALVAKIKPMHLRYKIMHFMDSWCCSNDYWDPPAFHKSPLTECAYLAIDRLMQIRRASRY